MSTGTHTTMLAKEPFINVTSFKRDGTAVATPVWCVGKNGSLLVFSEADSGKVKIRPVHVIAVDATKNGRTA